MGLTYLEIKTITERARALSNEEKKLVMMCMPTEMIRDELDRRTDKSIQMLRDLFNVLETVKDGMTVEEMQEVLANCRETLKMKVKKNEVDV